MIRYMCTKSRYFSNLCQLKPFKDTKWLQPDGQSIGVYVHNCIAGEKVPIFLNEAQMATWYSCGPTVYDSPHIGHASCYVKLDILQRILRHFFSVKLISAMGITDIDDKIINKAKETGTDFRDIAKQYEHEFWLDMSKLGVEQPPIVTRVSENIPCIIEFVKKLIHSGDAYSVADGSVYFDTTKYGDYGKLQKMQDNSELTSTGKRSEMDFALWKGQKPGEPFWETEWGSGRPGWHIECSAMVSKVFGPHVDFHAGGIDLQFPHHENEECQSCAYHDRPQWTNYWLHVGLLHVKDEAKMSKSLSNTISVSEMLKKHSSDSFRMACLLSGYRHSMEYSDEMMENAAAVLKKFQFFLKECVIYINDTSYGDGTHNASLIEKLQNLEQSVDSALSYDFDTSKCINTMLPLVATVSKIIKESGNYYPVPVLLISEYVKSVLSRLGITLNEDAIVSVPDKVADAFVEFRHTVRLNALLRKDKSLLAACDVARKKLKSFNIQINDSSKTSSWVRVK